LDATPVRDLQYLSLRTAATLAYMRLVGRSPDARDIATMHRVLNDVAYALASVAPVHTYDEESGKLAPIDARDVARGRFERGGATLIGPDGKEHGQPLIQRRELDSAVGMLLQTDLARSLQAVDREP
jgi:hypothetical protein